jgi:hypothetical protein
LLLFVWCTSSALTAGVNGAFLKRKCSELHIDADIEKSMLDVWMSNSKLLSTHYLKTLLSCNRLVDVDWNFGVTSTSSESNHLGKTFLQLRLTILLADGRTNQQYCLELSLDQFYHLLATLEKSKQFIDFLSPR